MSEANENRRRPRKCSRKKALLIVLAVVLAILAAAAVFLVNSGLRYRAPAASVGRGTYSVGALQYFYMDSYHNLVASGAIDPETPLDAQLCNMEDKQEGEGWRAYFKRTVSEAVVRLQAWVEQAEAEGRSVSAEGAAEVDGVMDAFARAAEENSMELAEFVRAYYGDGVTPELVRELLTKSKLASEYARSVWDGLRYTDAELDAYMSEHIDEYRTYSYLFNFVADSAVPPVEDEAAAGQEDGGDDVPEAEAGDRGGDGEGEQSGETPLLDENGDPVLDENGDPVMQEQQPPMTAAQRFANIIASYCTDEESFRTAVDTLAPGEEPRKVEGVLKEYLPVPWIAEEGRKYGEFAIATGENEQGESGCYVLMFLGSDDQDYPEVNVRHILVAAVDEDENKRYSQEEKSAALKKLREIRAEWESGEQTEERFAALAEQYSDDANSNTDGGLYEGVYQGLMTKEFNDFCFAEGRKPGDVSAVYGETDNYTGYHLIYYVSQGRSHRDMLAWDALQAADYNAWAEQSVEGYALREEWGARPDYLASGV